MPNINTIKYLNTARQHFVATLDAVLQKRFDTETVIFTGRRGQGMSIISAHIALRAMNYYAKHRVR